MVKSKYSFVFYSVKKKEGKNTFHETSFFYLITIVNLESVE